MKQFIERMLQKKTDLEGKIRRAKDAISVNPFNMDRAEKNLLQEQLVAMESYLLCLNKRLAYEEKKYGR